MDCIIKNARLVTPGHAFWANIGIRDGRFAAIVDMSVELQGSEIIDAGGRYVLPGVVDPHVHLTPKPRGHLRAAPFVGNESSGSGRSDDYRTLYALPWRRHRAVV